MTASSRPGCLADVRMHSKVPSAACLCPAVPNLKGKFDVQGCTQEAQLGCRPPARQQLLHRPALVWSLGRAVSTCLALDVSSALLGSPSASGVELQLLLVVLSWRACPL